MDERRDPDSVDAEPSQEVSRSGGIDMEAQQVSAGGDMLLAGEDINEI